MYLCAYSINEWVFNLVNITSKHGRKTNRARNTLLVKKTKRKSNLSCIKETKAKEKKNRKKSKKKRRNKKSNAVGENHNVGIFIQKYIWIILERDCSARGEKENLLFSRVIHARFFLMQKTKTDKQRKKRVSHVYLDWIDTKKWNKRQARTQSKQNKVAQTRTLKRLIIEKENMKIGVAEYVRYMQNKEKKRDGGNGYWVVYLFLFISEYKNRERKRKC